MIILFITFVVIIIRRFIKQKKKSQILIYLGIGFLIVFPWLITNVRTTGYLVYLFSGIDLFHVPWKIAPEVLKYSVDNMIASARNPSWPMAEVLNCGLAWVESWWSRESISHQILYIGIVIFVVFDTSNLCQYSCSINLPDAGDGEKDLIFGGIKSFYSFGYGYIQCLQFLFKSAYAIEGAGDGSCERLIEAFVKPVGVSCSLLQQFCCIHGIDDPSMASGCDQFNEFFDRCIDDLFRGSEFCQDRLSCSAVFI